MRGLSERLWLGATGVLDERKGFQDLIAPAIVASLEGCTRVYFPFPTSYHLLDLLAPVGIKYTCANIIVPVVAEFPPDCDALYFGTPTLVDGKLIFPEGWGQWSVAKEQRVVERLCLRAGAHGMKRIVSGLGSGDVSPAARMEAMGKGTIQVAHLTFDGFDDYVFARSLR